MIFNNCSPCHRPGEAAPFALLTYEEVRKRGEQIVEVIDSGFMPPWLPSPQKHAFADTRRLSDRDKDLVLRWVEQGMTEGAADDLPDPPSWVEGWQLGEPDLVIDLPVGYVLPAEGPDVFRSFVLPIDVAEPRFVQSVEVRPQNPKIIHHGVILMDRSRTGRRLDAEDSTTGFAGMQQSHLITSPGGHFIGWTPGKVPKAGEEDMAWSLEPGTDLVAALHMLPSGKPEPVGLRLGLHFAERRPTRIPAMIELENQAIDITAGEKAHTIEDSFLVPVDVRLLGIYPHAHYLAKEMHVTATTPAGHKTDLLHIEQWNFNWQDDYRFEQPVALEADTVIAMRFIYDNSADNDLNPNVPPKRVTYGELSSDEMGSLWLQVLPRRAADLDRLQQALTKKRTDLAMEGFRFALKLNPAAPKALVNLGAALSVSGKITAARGHFEQALLANPEYVPAHFNFGHMLLESDDLSEAKPHFAKAIALDPTHAPALSQLGNIASQEQDHRLAVEYYQRALTIRPNAETYYNLGVTHIALEQPENALPFLEKAAELEPGEALTHLNLGACYFSLEDWSRAEIRFRNAVKLDPLFVAGYLNLGNSLVKQNRIQEALTPFQTAAQIDPNNPQTWESLRAIQQLIGRGN